MNTTTTRRPLSTSDKTKIAFAVVRYDFCLTCILCPEVSGWLSDARVMRVPLPASRAVEIVEMWLSRANVAVPAPTRRHYAILLDLVAATGVGGNIVSDAHLATLAIEHGAELWSFDSDFGRVPGVDWRHP